MNDPLSRPDGQGVGGQGNVLCLCQGLRLEKGEAGLTDRGDVGIVWVARRVQEHMDDDRVLSQPVEVWYRVKEDIGRRGD